MNEGIFEKCLCTRKQDWVYKHHIVGGKFSILNKTEKDAFSYLEVWGEFSRNRMVHWKCFSYYFKSELCHHNVYHLERPLGGSKGYTLNNNLVVDMPCTREWNADPNIAFGHSMQGGSGLCLPRWEGRHGDTPWEASVQWPVLDPTFLGA